MRWLLIGLFLVTFGNSQAQIRVVKFNAASSIMLSPGLAFESVSKKQFSWQLSASYRPSFSSKSAFISPALENRNFENLTVEGFSVTAEYRFYTSRSTTDPTK
ncbi:MAG: DUF3575 domain-containing protein, partial [Flavobacteriales bacterium]|nr:DUF3575 domain-containing protein [Flavobacteriales bacterium]